MVSVSQTRLRYISQRRLGLCSHESIHSVATPMDTRKALNAHGEPEHHNLRHMASHRSIHLNTEGLLYLRRIGLRSLRLPHWTQRCIHFEYVLLSHPRAGRNSRVRANGFGTRVPSCNMLPQFASHECIQYSSLEQGKRITPAHFMSSVAHVY